MHLKCVIDRTDQLVEQNVRFEVETNGGTVHDTTVWS